MLPHWGVVALKALWVKIRFEDSSLELFVTGTARTTFNSDWLILTVKAGLIKITTMELLPKSPCRKRHKWFLGAKVFNAGANQCVQTMMMAREVGTNGFVWAIEPNPHNAQAGLRNCQLNDIHLSGDRGCGIIKTGAASWFNRSMNGQVAGSAHEVGAHLVDVVTIDDFVRQIRTAECSVH